MSSQNKEEVPLTFDNSEEEEYSVFQLEDLIKEYNERIFTGQSPHLNVKSPLSPHIQTISGEHAILRPISEQEWQSMRPFEPSNWTLFKEVLQEQYGSAKGLIGNTPNLAAGVTVAQLVSELGLTGKVYHKKVGDKTYVILKGYAGQRGVLRGTRYLNTHPQIVELGLAKVNVKSALKAGYKTSIYMYGSVKAIEALEMVITDGEIKPRYFSEVPADIPKLAINSLLAVGTGAAVVTFGVPAALGAGIVLTVSILGAVTLDFVDKKVGFTDTISNAAERMWQNLKTWWNTPSKKEEKPLACVDPLAGFIFGGSIMRNHCVTRVGDHYVHTI